MRFLSGLPRCIYLRVYYVNLKAGQTTVRGRREGALRNGKTTEATPMAETSSALICFNGYVCFEYMDTEDFVSTGVRESRN